MTTCDLEAEVPDHSEAEVQSTNASRAGDTPLLSIRNLSVKLGQLALVDGVSLDVYAGMTHGLVGESGSGKSVTALAVLGLFNRRQFQIRADAIWLASRDIRDLSEREMQRIRGSEISMIFQEPMTALNPVLTIGEQIIETLCVHQRLSRRQARAEAAELLGRVRIPAPQERLDDYPHNMSGGMRQRVMIAIAIACRPRLLIADEPTTALDVTIQAQILELLHDLQGEIGMGILLITHDLGVVAGYARDVSVMYAGHVVESGSVGQLFQQPLHPYTEGLLQSHPPVDQDVETLLAIPGNVPEPGQRPSGCRFGTRCRYFDPACAANEPALLNFGARHHAACIRHTGYRHAAPAPAKVGALK
jgi:oligopeptide/dipeptide ABC transporter ATP-binding protein